MPTNIHPESEVHYLYFCIALILVWLVGLIYKSSGVNFQHVFPSD